MNKERSSTSFLDALRQLVRFWRTLLAQTSVQQMSVASALMLLGSLSEGLALLFLIPLVQLLDPAAGATQGAMAWLPRLLQDFGLRLNLVSILSLFIGLVAVHSFLNRQSELYAYGLGLNFIRDTRVALYSAIAHAKWSFLCRRRPADLLWPSQPRSIALMRVQFALEMLQRAVLIGVHVIVACLIAPA